MTEFSKNGCLLVNGTEFFPVGLFSVPHAKAFPHLRDAGFNLVHSYEFERTCFINLQSIDHSFLLKEGLGDEAAAEYLDEAEKWGLKVMLGFDRTTQLHDRGDDIPAEQEEAMTGRVAMMKDKPALLAWYTVDEPDMSYKNITEKKCIHARDIVRKTDPNHPTLISMFHESKFEIFKDTADIILHDLYVFPGGNAKDVPNNIISMRKQTNGERPIWFTVQAFDWKHYNWDGPSVVPSYDQKRCLTYLAIIAGAKGILFFSYENETHSNAPDKAPEQWAELSAISKQLHTLQPVLQQSFTEATISFDGEIYSASTTYDGSIYLFCANSGDTLIKGNIAPDITDNYEVEVLFEDRKIKPNRDGLYDEFGPYADRKSVV